MTSSRPNRGGYYAILCLGSESLMVFRRRWKCDSASTETAGNGYDLEAANKG